MSCPDLFLPQLKWPVYEQTNTVGMGSQFAPWLLTYIWRILRRKHWIKQHTSPSAVSLHEWHLWAVTMDQRSWKGLWTTWILSISEHQIHYGDEDSWSFCLPWYYILATHTSPEQYRVASTFTPNCWPMLQTCHKVHQGHISLPC